MQEIFLKKLGENIKGQRKAKNLTLSNLCYKNNLEPSTVSRIEKAQVDAKISTLLKIAAALGTTLDNLITFED